MSSSFARHTVGVSISACSTLSAACSKQVIRHGNMVMDRALAAQAAQTAAAALALKKKGGGAAAADLAAGAAKPKAKKKPKATRSRRKQRVSSAESTAVAQPVGDPKLTERDESTICPGLFLCGPQVRQGKQILCFVYKYRQRFAVVLKEIATRLGMEEDRKTFAKYQKIIAQVEAECREQHMFLADPSCAKHSCGAGSAC